MKFVFVIDTQGIYTCSFHVDIKVSHRQVFDACWFFSHIVLSAQFFLWVLLYLEYGEDEFDDEKA